MRGLVDAPEPRARAGALGLEFGGGVGVRACLDDGARADALAVDHVQLRGLGASGLGAGRALTSDSSRVERSRKEVLMAEAYVTDE